MIAENAENDIQIHFASQFSLPGELWSKYVMEVVTLNLQENVAECGLNCKLHPTGCDFFALDHPNCYLASFSTSESDLVNDPQSIMTYHSARNYQIMIACFLTL